MPLSSAVQVQLSCIHVEDASFNRYVVLYGLSLPQIGRWRVTLFGTTEEGQEVWRVWAGMVNVEIGFVDVGRGPYLCKSFFDSYPVLRIRGTFR